MFNRGEVLIVNQIVPQNLNVAILQHLSEQKFRIATEGKYSRLEISLNHQVPHAGFQLQSADKNNKISLTNPLNFFALIVMETVCEKINLKNYDLERVFWNYYCSNMEGYGHKDKEENNYISIVYNLHTTDGGTEIEGKFFKDEMGTAKVFHSNLFHKGVSSKTEKARYNLNIIIKI
jgi:hypothetical protein